MDSPQGSRRFSLVPSAGLRPTIRFSVVFSAKNGKSCISGENRRHIFLFRPGNRRFRKGYPHFPQGKENPMCILPTWYAKALRWQPTKSAVGFPWLGVEKTELSFPLRCGVKSGGTAHFVRPRLFAVCCTDQEVQRMEIARFSREMDGRGFTRLPRRNCCPETLLSTVGIFQNPPDGCSCQRM